MNYLLKALGPLAYSNHCAMCKLFQSFLNVVLRDILFLTSLENQLCLEYKFSHKSQPTHDLWSNIQTNQQRLLLYIFLGRNAQFELEHNQHGSQSS